MNIMQDIATALKSAIKDWEITKEASDMRSTDAPVEHKWDGAIPTKESSVAHRIFTYVRDNQGMTTQEYVQKLSDKGLIVSSVGSYIFQMLKSNLLYADADRKIYTKYTEYKTPTQIKPKPKKAKPPPKRKAKAKAKPTTVSVPQTVTLATPAPAAVRTVAIQQKIDSIDQDVEKIMATINLRTAYALFFILKKMFKE